MSFFDKVLDVVAFGAGIVAAVVGGPIAIGVAVGLAAASGVNNYINAKEAAKELAQSLQAKTEGIKANKTTAGGRIPIIYGSRRVGAQVVYLNTADNSNQDLFVVYALCVGEIENIDAATIEIDGTPIDDGERFKDGAYIGSDKVTSGNFSLNSVDNTGAFTSLPPVTYTPFLGTSRRITQKGSSPTGVYRMVFNLHHGAETQTADPMLVASTNGEWTSNHKLNGIAYIAAKYRYDPNGMFRSIPRLTVEVQGKKVFDPRDTSQTFGNISTYKWSDNPALTFLDYITNDEYGKGLPIAKINTSTFTTAANLADVKNNNADFSGSLATLNWNGVNGQNRVYIEGFPSWRKFKVGDALTLRDNNNNVVVNERIITQVDKRYQYGSNTPYYIVYWDSAFPLTANYSVSGFALSKVRRFHCNGVVDPDRNIIENSKELLATMRGIFTYVDGKFELEIEDTGSSSFSINDSHIIGDSGITVNYGDKDSRANKVIVEYVNGQNNFEPDTVTILHNALPNFTSDDGGEELEITAQFPHITNPYIAYNMGKAILTRSRNQMSVSFTGTPEIYKLNIGDIVDLTYANLGFSGKVFRVLMMELQPNGFVNITLQEYFDVYTWEVPPQQAVNDAVNIPNGYSVDAPDNLTFTDTNSSSIGRPILTWDVPSDFAYNEYRVNVKDSSGNQLMNKVVNEHTADMNFLPKGSNYVASVSSLNSTGVESSATNLTFSVGDKPVVTNDIQDGSVGNVTADSGNKLDGTTTDNVISFYFGQSTSLAGFLSSLPQNTDGTHTLFTLATKSFTTPNFTGTKEYAFTGFGSPAGITSSTSQSILVLEVKTSTGTIVHSGGGVRIGNTISPHINGATVNLSGNTNYVASIYVGLKNFTASGSTLGFGFGFIEVVGLGV